MSELSQPPIVHKIEPPNWWIGLKWNHLQLMLSGDNLDGISVMAHNHQLKVIAVHIGLNSHYAFVDLEIPDDLPAGNYALEIACSNQSTTLDYPILEREGNGRRHRGFGVGDVIYLITPDRFANGDLSNARVDGILDDFDPSDPTKRHGGDLQGIIDHLSYLQDLGITAIWLNPVLENNSINSYHGYAATDLYRIDPRLGTNAEYKRLVEQSHHRQITVIFDHVSNHMGIRHP